MSGLIERSYRAWTEGRRSPGLFCFGAVAFPISVIYAVAARYDFSRKQKLRRPVLVNAKLVVLSSPLVGGVGKTPLAAHVATRALGRNRRVAIVTMGYRRSGVGDIKVDGRSSPELAAAAGDEAIMLHETTGCPVCVGDDPALVIEACDRSGAYDLIVFDDGISRSWDEEQRVIVLSATDCEQPVRYLPFGRWRTVPDFVKSGCGVAIIGRDLKDGARQERHRNFLRQCGFTGPLAWYEPVTVGIVASASDPDAAPPAGRAFVFSGLGMPERFSQQVIAEGIEIGDEERLDDHHVYNASDLSRLERRAQAANCQYLLTTHKDAVKIDPGWLDSLPLYHLNMTLRLVAGDDLVETILELP